VDEWPTLVGPRIAQHSRAVAFRDGTLHVEVEGSAWMQELGYLRRELARRINQTLGAEMVREVRLRVPRGGSLR
jgi:predicted nucleic acid-binding Zn ribbon protein